MGHDHGSGHVHAHGSTGRGRLAIALGITVVVLVAELIGAWVTGSLALLTDAAHMVTDVVGLAIALSAAMAIRAAPDDRRTWGLRRVEVIAALAQALLLLAVAGYVIVQAVIRIGEQPDIPPVELIVFAAIGLVGNVVALAVLWSGRSRSLNSRAAFTEVLGDALGSVAVIVAGVVIALTGWGAADAIAAVLIGAFIVPRGIRLMWDAVGVILETTPKGIDLAAIRAHIEAMPHVRGVHDLHVSRISSDLPVLTAHVVVDDECFTQEANARLLADLQACVAEHFPVSIEHSTFQIESEAHLAREHTAHA